MLTNKGEEETFIYKARREAKYFHFNFFSCFHFRFYFFQLSRLFDKARGRYFHVLRYMTDLGKAFTIENVGLKNG